MPPSGVVRIGCNIGQVSSTIAYVCMHAQSLNPKPYSVGFPGGSKVKASSCNVGDPGLIPGSGRSPGKGNGNPLQYYGGRSLVGYNPRGCKESDTTE